jgi:predicted RNA-binding Zn ribbon-like protein
MEVAILNNSVESGVFVVAPRNAMCLDFANTVSWRGSAPAESLHNVSDLLKWCGDAGLVSAGVAHQIRKWPDKHPKRAAEIFAEAIELREAIYRIFHCVAANAKPAEADLGILNRALRYAPRRAAVQHIGEGFGWQLEDSKPSASSLLAPVIWSAGDLLVGPQVARLRECSNDKCLWLFLDDSKNGTRRWCSMQACGNRAKAHRHYLRQKRAG